MRPTCPHGWYHRNPRRRARGDCPTCPPRKGSPSPVLLALGLIAAAAIGATIAYCRAGVVPSSP